MEAKNTSIAQVPMICQNSGGTCVGDDNATKAQEQGFTVAKFGDRTPPHSIWLYRAQKDWFGFCYDGAFIKRFRDFDRAMRAAQRFALSKTGAA